jgi:hypothetical protein
MAVMGAAVAGGQAGRSRRKDVPVRCVTKLHVQLSLRVQEVTRCHLVGSTRCLKTRALMSEELTICADRAGVLRGSSARTTVRRGSSTPPVKVLLVQWGANTTYATKRATVSEIEEVFDNRPVIRTNLRGRVATHPALGEMDAGRKVTVAFIYYAVTNRHIRSRHGSVREQAKGH